MAGGEDDEGRAVNKPVFPPYPERPPEHTDVYADKDAPPPQALPPAPPPPEGYTEKPTSDPAYTNVPLPLPPIPPQPACDSPVDRSDPPATTADEPVNLPPVNDENYGEHMSEVLAKVGEEELSKTGQIADNVITPSENLSTDPNMPVFMKRKRGRPRKHPLPEQRRPDSAGRRVGRPPKNTNRLLGRKIKKEPIEEPMIVEQMLEDELAEHLPSEQSLAQEEDRDENAIRFTDVGNHLPLLVAGQHLCAVCLSRHSHRQSAGVRRTRSTSFKRFTSVICRACNKFLCVAPRTDGRTCFDIYHTMKDFVRSDLPEFNRKECGDSDVISNDFDDSPDLTEDANMLLQLLQVASGEINKMSDLDNDRLNKDLLETSSETVFPENSESLDTTSQSLDAATPTAPHGSSMPDALQNSTDMGESETGQAQDGTSEGDTTKPEVREGQSQAISLLLKVLGQYGNARVLVRHLLTRWQDKLMLLGNLMKPKQRPPPSLGMRRPRKNTPKKYQVVDEGHSSEEDEATLNDPELDDISDSQLVPDPIRRKRGRPRKHPLKGTRHRLKKMHLLDKRHRCNQCDATFSIPSRLKEHLRIHTGERPYECDKCDMKFMRATHLKKHRMIHTGLRPFKCSMCGKTFTNNASLKEHTYTHTGERPHKCAKCSQSFTRRISLQEHMRMHTGEKPFQCPECELKFAKKSQLKAHMLYHTGEKPYLCQTCGARFRHNTAFNEHVRIHTGSKPFICQHCGTAFTCRSTLKKHIRLHTGEKPYKCTACGMGFAQRTSLVCHIKKHPGMTLPTKNAAKPSSKVKGTDVCIFPVVGRKKRTGHPQRNSLSDPSQGQAQTSTITMATFSSPVDHLLSGSESENASRMNQIRDMHLENARNQETSVSLSDGMTSPSHHLSSSPSVNHHLSHSHSQSDHTHPPSDHAHLRIPDRSAPPLHLEEHAHSASHLPMATAWSHDLPTQVPTFSYDQNVVHRSHQMTTQPFPGFLPMSTQMPPAFPDQQRFPLDYRFSMN